MRENESKIHRHMKTVITVIATCISRGEKAILVTEKGDADTPSEASKVSGYLPRNKLLKNFIELGDSDHSAPLFHLCA